jgi:hypothetical protein
MAKEFRVILRRLQLRFTFASSESRVEHAARSFTVPALASRRARTALTVRMLLATQLPLVELSVGGGESVAIQHQEAAKRVRAVDVTN